MKVVREFLNTNIRGFVVKIKMLKTIDKKILFYGLVILPNDVPYLFDNFNDFDFSVKQINDNLEINYDTNYLRHEKMTEVEKLRSALRQSESIIQFYLTMKLEYLNKELIKTKFSLENQNKLCSMGCEFIGDENEKV